MALGINVVFPEVINVAPAGASTDVGDARRLLPGVHANIPYDVSLILPMYNVAPYLERCLDSVFSQQDISLQVIIINDGSTDQSLDIATDYCRSGAYRNALVIDQSNRGLSATRNLGISLALAKFVAYLDTDDFMAPNAYASLYRFAVANQLDVVLCRSLVFDQRDSSFSEFYDAPIWDEILRHRHQLITNVWRDPDLLMLEPNANPRIASRDLVISRKLFFPEGLHFEDLPVHLRTLFSTQRVGLLGAKHYMYRVNRPGKITDQKSAIRFDILQIFDQTLQLKDALEISPSQGECLLYSLIRITYWCGTQTRLTDRYRFYKELGNRFASIPREWIIRFNVRFRNDLRQLIILWALRRRDAKLLCAISTGSRPAFHLAYFIVDQHRYGVIYHRTMLALKRLARITV
jgi:glycosyltransferase involved in cell wall biosynthesis